MPGGQAQTNGDAQRPPSGSPYWTSPVAIAQFAGEQGVDPGRIFAGAVVTTIVPLAVLLFFQRYFTQSLASTGSKG